VTPDLNANSPYGTQHMADAIIRELIEQG
jgi:isocitrate dehydrogenase (NAD+)